VAPSNGVVKLFVNRGRRSGIDEDDLRRALTEGAVVPEGAIEAIRVLERFSFVELDAEHADRVVDRLDGTKLKGRQVRVELARG
jgi:ATP-dependent RNA helicase DeaD